jgi:hypothetical protein
MFRLMMNWKMCGQGKQPRKFSDARMRRVWTRAIQSDRAPQRLKYDKIRD